MATTPIKGLQLPAAPNTLASDIARLITQANQIDTILGAIESALAGKVSTTTLAAYLLATTRNAPNGVAGLNASSQIDEAQLPPTVFGALRHQGTWNAATNSPALPPLTAAHKGKFWIVSVAGATNLSGITDWKPKDYVVHNGTAWDKIDNTDGVISVGGKTGAVTLVQSDIANLVADLAARPLATTVNAALDLKQDKGALEFIGGAVAIPGGRLTLTSNQPVMTADVANATTVFYTPYLHNMIMLWSGTAWVTKFYGQLSQALSDTTKSPSATAANSAYDMFVWDDAGTIRCTRGPSWGVFGGSLAARGAGAGSTELIRQAGALVNRFNIANGPLAGRGIYVGSFCTNAANQVAWTPNPAPVAGGAQCALNIWNMYNRVAVAARNSDSTASWPYSVAAWRAANGSPNNKINVFSGQNEDALFGTLTAQSTAGATNSVRFVSIGLDSITAPSAMATYGSMSFASNDAQSSANATFAGLAGQGQHYIQWLETVGSAAANNFFYGGAAYGLSLMWRA